MWWAGKLLAHVAQWQWLVARTVKVGLLTAEEVTDSTTEPIEELASVAAELRDEPASSRSSCARAMAA